MANRIFDKYYNTMLSGLATFTSINVDLVTDPDIDFENTTTFLELLDNRLQIAQNIPTTIIDGQVVLETDTNITFDVVGAQNIYGAVIGDENGYAVAYIDFGNIREVVDATFTIVPSSVLFRVNGRLQ